MMRWETTVALDDNLSLCELRQFIETAQGQAETDLILDDMGAPKAVHIVWTTKQGLDEYNLFDLADHIQELKTVSHWLNVERPTEEAAPITVDK